MNQNTSFYEYEYPVRVIFGDTDQMGVVYYGNYMRYFEGARAALLRDYGYSGKDLERWGVGFPVVTVHADYKLPAFYEDELTVVVWISAQRGASLHFDYRIERQTERGIDLLVTGFTRHACVRSQSGRPTRVPKELATAIGDRLSISS